MEKFSRLGISIGEDNLEKLKNSNIIIFGCGGVGTYAIETLLRSGVENITVVDPDTYSITNMNRQLYATDKTIGMKKVEVVKERAKEINENANIQTICKKLEKNLEEFNLKKYDFVLDCIDSIKAKMELMKFCADNNINIISSMGFGNKFSPEKIKLKKLKDTKICPMARIIRKEGKKNNFLDIMTVYSEEINLNRKFISPITEEEIINFDENTPKKLSPASNSFVPSVAGIFMTSYVIRKIIGIYDDK